MTEIIGVRFKDGGKLYYFNPNGVQVQAGQHVIIETSKGIEFGECALANTMIDEMELIAALPEPREEKEEPEQPDTDGQTPQESPADEAAAEETVVS